MFLGDIEFWFCCINPTERGVLRPLVEAIALTLNVGMPLDLYLALWAVFPENSEARRNAFASIYGLETVTVVPGGELAPYDAVRALDPVLYASWFVYVFTLPATCVDGCEQSTVGNP